MEFALWSLIVGALLVLMALSGSVLERLPLSTAMLYLVVGMGVSPWGVGLLTTTPLSISVLFEHLTEIVVLTSLFTAGLKLSSGISSNRWTLPVRLATLSMLVTVGAVTLIGWLLLDLPIGAAVLLGAVLAPTDPVLASDVQVQKPGDRDRLRFALTGEGGLNDGTAFPFVMLGLGLLGAHEIGHWGWRWFAVDVVWATACGLGVGAALGWLVGRLTLHLRLRYEEGVGFDDFLSLGLIALAYGAAVLLKGYGFLAVFAAGVALRQLVRQQSPDARESDRVIDKAAAATKDDEVGQPTPASMAVDPTHAPAYMAHAVLGFNEKIDRMGEVAAVLTLGALLWAVSWDLASWWLVAALLLVVRPLSVWIGLFGAKASRAQGVLLGWFGIRGIGSLYYLMYAINHGLPASLTDRFIALTIPVVVASIVLHGISVTPIMARYESKRQPV